MSYTPVDLVEVFAWGARVGVLSRSTVRGAYAFQYDPGWIRSGLELAPVIMPRRRAPYVFPQLPEPTYAGLPPMIADSLPDSFGNSLVDAWMAEQGVDLAAITALDRLVYLGNRGMGALEYRPDHSPATRRSSAIDLGELVHAARAAVQGTIADDASAGRALQEIINVGTSAGGARAKAIVNLDPATGEIRSGHTPPQPGFEPWLLKFDGVGADQQLGAGQQYGRVEYAYSLMARAAGIEMAPTRLLAENGRAHFLTRRFDREGRRKLHLQSLTGLAAVDFRAVGANSYAQVFTTIDSLDLGAEARTEAWRRMAFNVVATNNDDHAKNLSFLADEQGAWRLAPAYDVTFAYNPTGEWTNEHQLSVNGRFRDVRYADLMAVADQFEVERARTALGDIADAVASWPAFAAEAGLAEGHADAIGREFHREALA